METSGKPVTYPRLLVFLFKVRDKPFFNTAGVLGVGKFCRAIKLSPKHACYGVELVRGNMDNKTLAKAETAQNDSSSMISLHECDRNISYMISLHMSVTETIPP